MFGQVLASAPTIPTIDFGGQVATAVSSATSLLSDNVLYLFAIPIAWVGYKVVRKVIAKIG
jgi:hypothetical protein